MNIINGDCLEELKKLEDNSVDAVITDPPYGLSNTKPQQVADVLKAWVTGDTVSVPAKRGGFMGKDWDSFVPPPAVWEECIRVLKPGGHMAVFAGARTQDLMGLSIRLAGFEIRDTLGWVYGSGFPKSQNIARQLDKTLGEDVPIGKSFNTAGGGDRESEFANNGRSEAHKQWSPMSDAAKQWDGWGTALKPAIEPILLAQKPLNVVPLYEVANKTHHILGALKWLSLSPAKRAEITSTSNHQEPHAEMCASALANAETEQSPEKYAATDTFRSPEMALTYLNTEKLWQSILGAISDPTTTFTTSTESSTITVLKTLNSLLAPITSATTMPPCECLLNGQPSNVINVERNSSESWSNWQATLNVSVPESVIEQTAKTALSLLANIAENLSQPGTAAGGGSVLSHAQIGPITQSGESQNEHANGAGSLTSLAGKRGGSVQSAAQQNTSAIDPIILARKPLDGTVASNVLAHGVGGLNIDACRVPSDEITGWGGRGHASGGASLNLSATGSADGQPNAVQGRFPANVLLDEHAAKEMDKQSGVLKSGGVHKGGGATSSWFTFNKSDVDYAHYPDSGGASRFFPVFKSEEETPETKGRFPANVLLDEHAAAEMDEQSGVLKDRGNKSESKSTYSGGGATAFPNGANFPFSYDTGGGASRFFPVFKYQAKAPKKERPVIEREDGTKIQHNTVKPLALMEWLVSLIVPPGGVVLDPFAGSGTTLQAALNKGFQPIGIEQDADYIKLIEQRLAA